MPKFVLTIDTETELEARNFAKLIDEYVLHPANYYDAVYDFTDFVGKPGELDV